MRIPLALRGESAAFTHFEKVGPKPARTGEQSIGTLCPRKQTSESVCDAVLSECESTRPSNPRTQTSPQGSHLDWREPIGLQERLKGRSSHNGEFLISSLESRHFKSRESLVRPPPPPLFMSEQNKMQVVNSYLMKSWIIVVCSCCDLM